MTYLKKEVVDGQLLRNLQDGEVVWKGTAKYGILGKLNTGISMYPKAVARHMLFLGSIGSGKSNCMELLVEGLREHTTEDDIFVFFDAKGDYYDAFYKDGDYVLTNSLEPIAGTVYWNIFEDIIATHPEKQDEVIWEIAAAIFKEDIESSSSPIFATGARDLFAAILSAFVRNMEKENTMHNHETFIKWLQMTDDIKIRNLLLDYEDLLWVRNYISKENDIKTNQSFLMHLYQNLFNIFNGAFRKPGNFSLTQTIKNRGGNAVFLEYDIASANTLKPIYTLLIDIAMKNVLAQKESERRGRVFFILDEFPLIPRLNYMDNALNFGRSLGVRVIAGIQNVGQVQHTYGEGLGNSILAGFGTTFAFRLFDEPSRSFVMNRHGKNKKNTAYAALNSAKGIIDDIIDGNVIEDWDLTDLQNGQCIVSPFEGEPFKFHPIQRKTEGN